MKCLCILFFVAVAQGFVLKDDQVLITDTIVNIENDLPNPALRFLKRSTTDLTLSWWPTTSDDAEDPIVGYKITITEHRFYIEYREYKVENMTVTVVEQCVAEDKPSFAPEVINTQETEVDYQLKSPNAETRMLVQSLSEKGRESSGMKQAVSLRSPQLPDYNCSVM